MFLNASGEAVFWFQTNASGMYDMCFVMFLIRVVRFIILRVMLLSGVVL
jgi:hypothetical protein